LLPISKIALPLADQSKISFEAFFTHILMHELMHGLGPHNISAGGRQTTVRQELKETYSAIEEAKADVSGLWALRYLADHKLLDPAIAKTMYSTFLASAFRSPRAASIVSGYSPGSSRSIGSSRRWSAVCLAPNRSTGSSVTWSNTIRSLVSVMRVVTLAGCGGRPASW